MNLATLETCPELGIRNVPATEQRHDECVGVDYPRRTTHNRKTSAVYRFRARTEIEELAVVKITMGREARPWASCDE